MANQEKKIRVLLVEDDRGVRKSTARLLASYDFEVITATGLEDAKEKIRTQGKFDVLITDKDMPEKDEGLRLLESPELKANNIDIKVIISGDSSFTCGFDAERNALKVPKSGEKGKGCMEIVIEHINTRLNELRGAGR